MKVTVVGAGNVGATCANVLAHMDFLKEVILLDIKEGTAEGKALTSGRPHLLTCTAPELLE
jgi:malate dehydrogenase